MKKLLALPLAALFIFSACESSDDYGPKKFDRTTTLNSSLTESFELSIENGRINPDSITIVKLGDEILYRGNVPTVIEVPKYTTLSRGISEIECFFDPSQGSGNIDFFFSSRTGILLFEDSPGGDADYNDFVCNVIEKMTISPIGGNKYQLDLDGTQLIPCAVGNYLHLKVGMEIRETKTGKLIKDVLLAGNARKDFFGIDQGYVNSVNESNNPKELPGTTCPIDRSNPIKINEVFEVELDNPLCINWYISVPAEGGDDAVHKFYTIETSKFLNKGISYSELATDNNIPYGLFIPGRTHMNFQWPAEGVKLWDAYPRVYNWLSGEDIDPFSQVNSKCLY